MVNSGQTEGNDAIQELLTMSALASTKAGFGTVDSLKHSPIFRDSHARAAWRALLQAANCEECRIDHVALVRALEPSTITAFTNNYLKDKGKTARAACRRLIKFLVREAFPFQLHVVHTRLLMGIINTSRPRSERKQQWSAPIPPLLAEYVNAKRAKVELVDPKGATSYRNRHGYWRTSLYQCRVFMRWLADRRGGHCSDSLLELMITSTDVRAYRDHLMTRVVRRDLTAQSAATVFNTVSGWIRWLHTMGYLWLDPSQGIAPIPASKSERILHVKETDFARFAEALERTSPDYPRDFTFLCLIAYLGARPCEVLRLRRRDVALDVDSLTLHGKGGAVRPHPLKGKICDIVRCYLASLPSHVEFLFPNTLTGNPLGPGGLYYVWSKARAYAKLPPSFTRYALRHHRALTYVLEGESVKTIMDRMGWKTPQMLTTYAHPSIDDRRKILAALPALGVSIPSREPPHK